MTTLAITKAVPTDAPWWKFWLPLWERRTIGHIDVSPVVANPSGITPLEFKVLVKPSDFEVDPVFQRAREQGIAIPQDVAEREFAAQIVATFIAKGGNAFIDWKDERLPAPGDTVLIAKYAGITVKGADGVEYRMLNDKDVSGLITLQGVSRV